MSENRLFGFREEKDPVANTVRVTFPDPATWTELDFGDESLK